MTPIETAKDFFGDVFYELVDYYFENGYAYCGPDAFALAMPHNIDTLMELNLNKKLDKRDCWLVQYVSGDINRLLDLLSNLPFEYEHIVFERDDEDVRFTEENRYRVYNTKRLTEKLNGKRR